MRKGEGMVDVEGKDREKEGKARTRKAKEMRERKKWE